MVKGPVNWENKEIGARGTMRRLGGRGIIDIESPTWDEYSVANLHYSIICPRGDHRRTVPSPNSASVVAYQATSNEQVRHPGTLDQYSG